MAERSRSASRSFPQSYHVAWLKVHPWRTADWLREKMREGFHIHHVDGDHSNDDPSNLVLIDGDDHMALHGVPLRDGIAKWRKRERKQIKVAVRPPSEEGARLYLLKAELDCSWKALAQQYYNGVKPNPNAIWSMIGVGLMAKARNYAKRVGKSWPPVPTRAGMGILEPEEIAALLSRQ